MLFGGWYDDIIQNMDTQRSEDLKPEVKGGWRRVAARDRALRLQNSSAAPITVTAALCVLTAALMYFVANQAAELFAHALWVR